MDNLYTHQIIPGILEKDWTEIEKKIEIIKTFSKKIHIDIIDEKFSPNQTFLDPTPFSKFNDIYLEAHLMVEEPINYLDSFAKAGFKKFIGHVEKMASQEEFVAKAELLGEVSLGLDVQTSIDEIKVPFDDLDSILLMCVNAGKSNQEFQSSALEKVKILKQVQNDNSGKFSIEVDGGINDQTILSAKDAGANIFVATSYISDNANPLQAFQLLKSKVSGS